MINIIDCGMGNIGSVANMLRYIGVDSMVANTPNDLGGAQALILPGVGSFDHGMQKLRPFISKLEQMVLEEEVPLLGICLGMHMLFQNSEEGQLSGLGWVKGRVRRFDHSSIDNKRLMIPHMGWNTVNALSSSELFSRDGFERPSRFYFVHSFHADDVPEENWAATTHYGYEFISAVEKNNIFGIQFHPEKSHRFGKEIFERFLRLAGC